MDTNILEAVRLSQHSPLQAFYDKTIRHLLTQGKQAISTGGNCWYRSPDGLSCAVGCHIPDELYSPVLEKKSITTICDTYIADVPAEQREAIRALIPSLELAQALQVIHDSSYSWDENGLTDAAKRELGNVAGRFSLTPFDFTLALQILPQDIEAARESFFRTKRGFPCLIDFAARRHFAVDSAGSSYSTLFAGGRSYQMSQNAFGIAYSWDNRKEASPTVIFLTREQ